MHSTSVCQPLAGLKAHAAEVALAQGVPGSDPTCSWLCLLPQHNASLPAGTASSLASDPWLLAICPITQNKRYHKIHLRLILVKFKNSERDHSGLSIPPFIFSNLFLLCQSHCCFAHMACLTSCTHTCMCVCTHTNPPRWN